VDAILEKPSTVGQGTKREVIETAVRNGRAIVEKMVEDTAAKKRDREAVDRVSRAGYMLGLSNENIPVVKAGLEAQARLKADKYQKPEYRMYSDSREDGPFREISKTEYDYAQSVKSKPGEAAAPAPTTEAAPTVKTLPNGWTNTRNGFTDRPVYRFNQGTGQPFAVVTETDDGYEVQVRHGDKQVSVEKMPGASRAEALSSASGMLAEVSTHKDPGEKSEAVTPTVVADAMKKAARNEDVKPADMKKWLLAELDKAMLEAPDREDYDATVKSFSAKDAEKMWTGNGPYGKDTHTGFLSFDVPGDGKFKVRNGMRGLLEFKQNVERSKGFSNTGARTAAPERNNGTQDGSGGRMSAITNMIDEGDFEAARDYAEAVGIPLADVKVPRGERKPQWDAFMKNGTVPPQPDTKPQPAPKTAAELDAEKKAAREAEANKPGDTGWNMAGEVDDVMADLRGGNAAPESDTYQSAYDTEVERMRELADKKGVPASGINDDLSASLASLSIGRGFNQSVDEFLSANPSKKGRRDAMMAWRNGQIDHKPGQSEWAKRREAAKPTEPTADAETAQKEAGSDKKFPAFPVDGYQLERFYANGAKVKPLPAKVFSQDEVRSITDWFKSIGWNVTSGSGANGVNATNDVGMTVDDLPEPYTAAQRKKYEAQRAADERAADKKKAQGDYLSSTEAGRFVSAMFGDAMNSFNLTALAKMLAGDEKTFNGMFSNRAADVLNESGISTEGREVKDVIRDIKAKFDLRNVERKEDEDGNVAMFSRARPVFSRAAQGQASGVVQSIVDAITARWANAPKVVVAFDMSDPAIPERVRQEDQRQRSGGAEGTPEGFYYKGTVYLMSSKLANPRDVVRVLFHESLGHFGLRGVFGKELKPLLQQIATMRKSQVEAKMKEYGLRGVSNVDRLVAAEEVLAEMAQSSPQIGFVRRAVATIKAWLRKNIPGFMGMNMSDDEIITSFIMPARNYVVNGGPDGGTGGGVRFNRSVGDASPDEAQKVQAAIEGKSLIDAAKFVVDTGEARHRVVAEMVTEKLKALQSAGVSLDLKIAHRGFPVPTALFNSRGYTESAFDDKGRDITVWLNGADVTGKVGTDYETLLHELVHAATMGGVLHGSTVRGSPFAKDAADLMEVTDAIASHINKRFDDADAGRVSLTEFELDMRAGANNAFTKDDETLAWALSSVEAQQYLETIPYKKSGQTMWGRFVQAVRSAIGLEAKADTALSEVLRLGASIMSTDGDANVRGVRAFWHKRGLKMATQQANGSVVLRNEVGPAYPDSPTHQKKMDQAETPEFKRWFGDSKVVDADGKPLVVYHGTAADFNAFDLSKFGLTDAGWFGKGFYFTEDKAIADRYGKTKSVFLSLEKPMSSDEAAFGADTVKQIIAETKRLDPKFSPKDWLEDDLAGEKSALDQLENMYRAGAETSKVLQAVTDVTGFDGVVSKGIYIAFNPTQIKSATFQTWGNNGVTSMARTQTSVSAAQLAVHWPMA
jgi:hypothetical protein